MKGIMKIQIMDYVNRLHAIQNALTADGITSQLYIYTGGDQLWSVNLFVGPEAKATTLYVWSPKLNRKADLVDNERKLTELHRRFVTKPLAVI